MRTHSRPLWIAQVSLLFGASLVLGVTQASIAHSEVAGTVPTDGQEITENPVDITITTAQALLDLGGNGAGFALVVQDAAGLYYGDGCLTVGETSLNTVAELGQPGEYVVTYQYVSADGHSVSGSFSFTLAESASLAVTGQAMPPVCGEGAPAASPVEPTSTDLGAQDTASSQPSLTTSVLVVAGGITLGAVVALWWMRRKSGRES